MRPYLSARSPLALSALLLLAPAAAAQLCQTQQLAAPDPFAGGEVGRSASLSGNTLAVGGPGVDLGGATSGAVYLFERSGGQWSFAHKLSSPVPTFNSLFGRELALAGDRLWVAANPGLVDVRSYRREAGVWQPTGKLAPSGSLFASNFGHTVSAFGDRAAVAAPQAPTIQSTSVRPGAVYLFRDQGVAPVEIERLQPPELGHGDDFGQSLAQSGEVLVVGTSMGNQLITQGRAYVYRWSEGAPVLEQVLQGAAAGGSDSQGATFGRRVATDGQRIAVADLAEPAGGFSTGAVWIWRHEAGQWAFEQRVTASTSNCAFGDRLDLSGDDLLVSRNCGQQLFHFRRVQGQWVELGSTPVDNSGTFQVSALDVEAGELVVGSRLSPAPLANAGQVRIYRPGSGSTTYGPALAGSGGIAPRLAGVGCPVVGQPYAALLDQGLGGTLGVLCVGAGSAPLALYGGLVQVLPIVAFLNIQLGGPVGVAGQGSLLLPLSFTNPSQAGVRVYLQALLVDTAAPQWLSFTNGLEVIVGL
jgi:hypothetical protein